MFKNTKLRTRQTKNAATKDHEKENAFSSSKNAPKVTGINKRNENFAAFSPFNPENNPAEIVMPLLETPGKSARACIKPINIEFLLSNLEK